MTVKTCGLSHTVLSDRIENIRKWKNLILNKNRPFAYKEKIDFQTNKWHILTMYGMYPNVNEFLICTFRMTLHKKNFPKILSYQAILINYLN